MKLPATEETGMAENETATKTDGKIAKRVRLELESQTGKSIVTGENYLPPTTSKIPQEMRFEPQNKQILNEL